MRVTLVTSALVVWLSVFCTHIICQTLPRWTSKDSCYSSLAPVGLNKPQQNLVCQGCNVLNSTNNQTVYQRNCYDQDQCRYGPYGIYMPAGYYVNVYYCSVGGVEDKRIMNQTYCKWLNNTNNATLLSRTCRQWETCDTVNTVRVIPYWSRSTSVRLQFCNSPISARNRVVNNSVVVRTTDRIVSRRQPGPI